jgi:hypothetical protein
MTTKFDRLKQRTKKIRRERFGYVRRDLKLLRERLRGGERPLPDTIVIGAQKAGTTTLYDALVLHPRVTGSYFKEVHFFDTDHDRGLDWYALNFPRKDEMPAGGRVIEASPYYLFHPEVPARVAADRPGVKILAILRDPVDRALSHFHHERRNGFETLDDPIAAFAAEESRLAGASADDPVVRNSSYVSRGLYHAQLKRWFAQFDRDDIHVVFLEELSRDRQETLDGVSEFLGIERHEYPAVRSNSGGEYARLGSAEIEQIKSHFVADVAQLEELLGRPVPWPRFSS